MIQSIVWWGKPNGGIVSGASDELSFVYTTRGHKFNTSCEHYIRVGMRIKLWEQFESNLE